MNKAERATRKKVFREARRQWVRGAEPEGKLLLIAYARFFDYYGLHSVAALLAPILRSEKVCGCGVPT